MAFYVVDICEPGLERGVGRRAKPLVALEVKRCQHCEVCQARRQLPGQLVVAEPQMHQLGQVGELRGYGPGQLVPAQR